MVFCECCCWDCRDEEEEEDEEAFDEAIFAAVAKSEPNRDGSNTDEFNNCGLARAAAANWKVAGSHWSDWANVGGIVICDEWPRLD